MGRFAVQKKRKLTKNNKAMSVGRNYMKKSSPTS